MSRRLSGGNRNRGLETVEARVGDGKLHVPRWHSAQGEKASVLGGHRLARYGSSHDGAAQIFAGSFVKDTAADGASGGTLRPTDRGTK